nr:coat protein [Sogatella furcifera toti-like virus 2]
MNFEMIGDINDLVLRDGKEVPHPRDSDDESDSNVGVNSSSNNVHSSVSNVDSHVNSGLSQPSTSQTEPSTSHAHDIQKRSPTLGAIPVAIGAGAAFAADLLTDGAAIPADLAIAESVAEGVEAILEGAVVEETAAAEIATGELPLASLALPIGPAISGLAPSHNHQIPAQPLVDPAIDQAQDADRGRNSSGAPGCRNSRHPAPCPPNRVRFGDNTIETSCTSAIEIVNLENIHGVAPDFIAIGGAFAQMSPDLFNVNNHTVQVQSIINPVTTQNATAAGITRAMDVFDHNAAPLAANATRLHQVKFTTPLHKGYVAPADLTPLTNGNVPSSRYVASMLQPALRPVSQTWLYAISGAIRDQLVFTDNRALYAKIITAALQQEIATYAGVVPVAAAWPGANTVTFINLDDPNLAATTLLAQIQRGAFVFVQDEDWDTNDLLATHWLAASGHRLTSEANTASLDAYYIDWPAIDVCVLHHGDAPARPAAALCSAEILYAFAEKMATYRHELDSLAAGIYMAMEAVGIRYYTVADVHYPLTSNFNCCPTYMPAPGEYNFMLRIAQIFPTQSELLIPEVNAFTSLSAGGRACTAALFNAAIGTFTTTVLYACSIQTINIVDWCTGAAPEAFVNTILIEGFCQPPQTEYRECIPYFIPKLAIRQYMGFTPIVNLYPGCPWNGSQNSNANAAHSFNPHDNDQSPRLYSCLSIDNFLLERPQEWAVLGPHTKMDIRHETRALGANANRLGVFTYQGSADYMNNSSQGVPYKFVPYGNQVVNALHQYFQLAAANVRYNACGYQFGLKGDWEAAADYDNAILDANLHILQPCTLQSFDFGDNEVRAPCMNGNCLTADQRRRLQMFNGGEVDYVGFALRRTPSETLRPLQPVPIAAFRALGMFGSRNKGSVGKKGDAPGTSSEAAVNPT